LKFVFTNHVLDADRRELRRGTTLVAVEPQVFDLILYLVRNRDRVVTKDDLVEAVWGGRIVSESALTTRINAARSALGDTGKGQQFIRTLPRKGVRFVDEVEEQIGDRAPPQDARRDESAIVVRAEARAYCVLTAEDEAATRNALHNSRELVVANLKHRRGRLLSTSADTVVAVFTDPAQAVVAAADAGRALSQVNQNLPSESRVHYRFGVASGQLVAGPEGPGGPAIERAASLGLRAPSGGVRLSESVVAALPPEPAFVTVKTEAEDYELAAEGASASVKGVPLQLQSLDPPLPSRPSIVLLPFKAIGEDQDRSETIAEGLRIEVQNALTKMAGVFILGVGSAVAMRGWSPLEAAGRTGVRYVLEGMVQRAGEQVRVNVQLTDTVAGAVILSEHYDRVLDRGFALQDEITARIVTALDVKLNSGEQARIWHKGLADPITREHFYRGIQTFFRMNAESIVKARDSFVLVAKLAPDSPLGPTWVALCHWFESARGWAADPALACEQAGLWAERAAAMEDADGQAQTVLGNVRLLQRRFDEAIAIAHKALAIRPGCTNANGFLANVLLYCGEPHKAISHAGRAIRYMPVYPPWFVEILAAAYRDAGLFDLAIIAAREILRIAPSSMQGRFVLASALVRSGWLAEARCIVNDARRVDAHLSLGRWAASQPYRNPHDLDAIVEALRRAGVPE
jgi:adenylate cyclase